MPNANQCRSMQIKILASIPMSINSDQLIGIDRHWETFRINTMILTGIGHWPRELCRVKLGTNKCLLLPHPYLGIFTGKLLDSAGVSPLRANFLVFLENSTRYLYSRQFFWLFFQPFFLHLFSSFSALGSYAKKQAEQEHIIDIHERWWHGYTTTIVGLIDIW